MCEGLRDVFLYCNDWPSHNFLKSNKKWNYLPKREKKRQMKEEYVAFFLRHIVLNSVVWLKLKHYVFRRQRRMFRHNGLKDSLSQVQHFILQFILVTRKATSAKVAWQCPSRWNTCPSPWLHNVWRAGLSDSLTNHPSWPTWLWDAGENLLG